MDQKNNKKYLSAERLLMIQLNRRHTKAVLKGGFVYGPFG
jgi:hypothetical protein